MKNKWEKFELFMQGFFFRVSFLVFFILFIGVFVYAYYTEQKIAEVGDTAPFATGTARVDDSIEDDAIGSPHRTRREMQTWLVESVSVLLNLDAQNLNAILDIAKPSFTTEGYAQYTAWLGSNDMMTNIRADKIRLDTIVDQTPVLLNDGVIGNKYRWLYDVPVILTVVPTRGGQGAQNNRATLRIQLGRVDESVNTDKMVIESWSMTARR